MAEKESNEIGRNLESDMLVIQSDNSDLYLLKVFKTYPLLGDCVMKPSNQARIFENAKKVIDIILLAKDYREQIRRITQEMHEQVFLAVVDFAKKWNSNEESKFTRYVAMQFGYKDETGRVWGIITDSIEKALVKNKRLFIIRNGIRQFYETVMVHSMGPGKSWFPLFDLLFRFYTENLRWNYAPHDPLFYRLTSVLQSYFNNDVREDDEILIASKSYKLRIGIRRLVQERPGYSAQLFEQIVKRMDLIVNNEAKETKHYYAALLDDWFAEKISKAEPVSSQQRAIRKEKNELAFSYKSITLRYVLSDNKVFVSIPSIRLEGSCLYAKAEVYLGERLLCEDKLDIYGNELGETIIGKYVLIPLENNCSNEINTRIKIFGDEKIIYDSEKKLFRKLLIFSEGKEVAPGNLRKERYRVALINKSLLEISKADITSITANLYEIAFHKDYSLRYDGYMISEDYSDIKSIRVQEPEYYSDVKFIKDGIYYDVLKEETSLRVYIKDYNQLKKYAVDFNGEMSSLMDFYDHISENRAVVRFDSDGYFSVSVIDLEKDQVIFKKSYIKINDFKYEFNRTYYLKSDLNSLVLVYSCSGEEKKNYTGISVGNEISIEAFGGELKFEIPVIDYEILGIENIFFDKYILTSEIVENSTISFTNHSGFFFSILVGEIVVDNPKNIRLQDIIKDNKNNDNIEVQLRVLGNETTILNIVKRPMFVMKPKITFSDNMLFWDGGSSFVGDIKTKLQLILENVNDNRVLRYDLTIGKNLVSLIDEESFDDGYYYWAIEDIISSDIIEKGKDFFGNISKVRFEGKQIIIDKITQDTEEFKKHYNIKQVCIEKIKYLTTEYIPAEEDIYDIYSGSMYWLSFNNDKRYFSSRYDEKRSKYKVNPVKIIYISDKFLRVVNEDDEGLLFYYNDTSREPGWEITDFEPKRAIKGYFDALFFIYRTELIDQSFKQVKENYERLTQKNEKGKNAVVNVKTETVIGESLKMMLMSKQEDVIRLEPERRIVVNAGPGTGKTWTLIEKVIYLVDVLGVEASTIQVLCFSRAAVEVVRARMNEAIREERASVEINNVDIRTFDSFATQLLYWVKESEYSAISKNYSIEKLTYEERINKFVEVIKKEPQLISQCTHLIVDEVQDLVSARADMVLTMISSLPEESGVTLLGDACQAIYDYQVDGEEISSRDFYRKIEELHQFTFMSFSENHRQNEYLIRLSSAYRKPILQEDSDAGNKCLNFLLQEIPEFDESKIQNFEEDTLDRLTENGKVGILTRSNAQALKISSLFRKKNIAHIIQRRANDNSFAGWIGKCFNEMPFDSYNESLFLNITGRYLSDINIDKVKLESLWNNISSLRTGRTGRTPTRDLLANIRNGGRSDILFDSFKDSDVVISTIHRSKGREYDTVIILDELLSESNDSMEEHRVNYVAITRAKKRVFTAKLANDYIRMLDDRRCFAWSFSRNGKHVLKRFEIGLENDFDLHSFAVMEGTQEFLRDLNYEIINREVYLVRNTASTNGYVSYYLKTLKEDIILAETSYSFAKDLEDAIRRTKNLPSYQNIFDNLYPKRLSGLFIDGYTTEIGISRGDEDGITEYGDMIAWNTVRIEGFSLLEY